MKTINEQIQERFDVMDEIVEIIGAARFERGDGDVREIMKLWREIKYLKEL